MGIEMPSNPASPEAIFNTVTMGVLTKSVAGGADVTLSDAEARNAVHSYTGTLTGNISVVVPAAGKIYFVHNGTSGAFTLTVKTASGTGVDVTQGSRAILVCDGVNVEAWAGEV